MEVMSHCFKTTSSGSIDYIWKRSPPLTNSLHQHSVKSVPEIVVTDATDFEILYEKKMYCVCMCACARVSFCVVIIVGKLQGSAPSTHNGVVATNNNPFSPFSGTRYHDHRPLAFRHKWHNSFAKYGNMIHWHYFYKPTRISFSHISLWSTNSAIFTANNDI